MVSMTPATRRRYSAFQLALPKGADLATLREAGHEAVVVVAAEHEDDCAGLLLPHHLGHVLEPVEDVRALETARNAAVDVADRLDRAPLAHCSQDRLTRYDDERVARDPDPEWAGRRELLSGRGRDRCRVGRRRGNRDARVDLIVLRPAERGFERATRLVEEERLADRRQRLGNGKRSIPLPALGLDLRRLVQPGRIEESSGEKGEEGDHDGRACRVQPPPIVVDASAGMSSPRGHQNWK